MSPSGASSERRQLIAALLAERGIRPASKALLPAAEISGPARLSLNQEGLWIVEQVHPGEANSSIPGALRLRGPIDVEALRRGVAEIVRRHEALRTIFEVDADAVPRQVIQPAGDVEIPLIDLRDLPATEREAEALRLATAEATRPFDLGQGPLLRASLVRLGDLEHVFVLNIHHIVADGWSMGILTRELSALYEAFSAGKPSPLAPLPIQFREAAMAERHLLSGDELERRLAYWRSQLVAGSYASELPPDHPRPRMLSMHGRHLPVRFSPDLSDQLRDFSRRERVTLFTTLRAAMAVLMHHGSGETDVVLGATLANRDRPDLEPIIGYFATMIPIRTSLSGNPTGRELLRRVQASVVEATAHALPFPVLVSALAPERDPSRIPFFQVELTLLTPDQNPAVYGYGLAEIDEQRAIGNLTATSLPVEGGVARFDLSLFFWDLPGAIRGAAEYASDLFEPETIVRLVARLEALLRALLAAPDSTVQELTEILAKLDHAESAQEPPAAHVETLHRQLLSARRRPWAADRPTGDQ